MGGPVDRASLYPVFLKLEGKSVLLVGGGEVAFRKARALIESRCNLFVVAKGLAPSFKAWLEQNRVEWEERPYRNGEAADYLLVISATDDPETNRRVFEDASRAERLCNVADQPHYCSLFVPSVLKRGMLQIAISTGGTCPAVAKSLRLELDTAVPVQYGPLLEKMAVFREHLKHALPTPSARKQALRNVLESEAVQRFLLGDEAPLETLLEEMNKDEL